MHNILTQIIASRKESIELQKRAVPVEVLKAQISTKHARRRFLDAVAGTEKAHIIAEIKQASPSAGIIAKEFDPVKTAKDYTKAGADAISILTEEKYFKGKLEYLEKVRAVTALPILRKDFIIDPYQLYESKAAGADAVLLIAAALDDTYLRSLAALAASLGMDSIIEVHTEEELKRVLSIPCEVIGINSRNLNDFTVSLDTVVKLAERIPKGRTIIAESGIKAAKDISYLRKAGINAFLIGETLMKSTDIEKTMKRFKDA